jgi:hypothetical protein
MAPSSQSLEPPENPARFIMPGEWQIGDEVRLSRGNELIVRGTIKEIVRPGTYRIEVLDGGIKPKRT